MRFSGRRRPPAGWILGLAVGAAAVGLGERAWREWSHPSGHATPVEARGERHGRARVSDGDSLVIAGTRLRLVGLDAPELSQTCRIAERTVPCGEEARARLVELVEKGPVDCVWHERDRYGRALARCRVGALDVGAAMVRAGWAVAYGGFEAEEAEARRNRRGLWAGEFEPPADFRRRSRGRSLFEDEE